MSQPAEKRMGVSDARANMTDVIAEVRLLGTPVVLTRRDKPQAALVSVDFYEQAKTNAALVSQLRAAFEGDTSVARTFQAHYAELYEATLASSD